MYFYYINIKSGFTLEISPVVNRLFRKIYRWLSGRQVFAMTLSPKFFMISFLSTCIFEIILNPGKLGKIIRLIRNSVGFKGLRFHYICIQSGPVFNTEKNQIQLCYHCPDATIRNGKLTPVCVADQINPLSASPGRDQISQSLFNTVYQHVEEI